MLRSLTLTLLLTILCGCFPRDQFWKKPDFGRKYTNLTEAAASPTPVRFISLNAQPQPVFPVTLYAFQSLERLSLRQTGLTVLPVEIIKLPKLLWLDLGANQLTELPVTIGELPALTTLYLSDNRLAALPATIGNLQTLR
ncbi:MAG: leucine-rich repeat domain-containing protein, partial [bacterium]